jgi:hypothetical protein
MGCMGRIFRLFQKLDAKDPTGWDSVTHQLNITLAYTGFERRGLEFLYNPFIVKVITDKSITLSPYQECQTH